MNQRIKTNYIVREDLQNLDKQKEQYKRWSSLKMLPFQRMSFQLCQIGFLRITF